MKLSRRELVALAPVSLAVQAARTQTPPAVPDPASLDPASLDPKRAARETVRRNSEALAKFDLPIATEPAVQFKP